VFPLTPADGDGLTLRDGHRGVTEADQSVVFIAA